MNLHLQLSTVKNYFLGFATSGTLLFSGLFYFQNKEKNFETPNIFSNTDYVAAEKIQLKNFDPNSLSADDWKALGFSERQTATILKYKNVIGGNFTSKEQLKNVTRFLQKNLPS